MALKNGAHRRVIKALTAIEARLPFPLLGLGPLLSVRLVSSCCCPCPDGR
jgi:hypothetical protein